MPSGPVGPRRGARLIRVGVHGASGRLGRLIVAEVASAPDLALAWACGRTLPADLSADVIVDVSTPEGLVRLLGATDLPVVSGTTGLTTTPEHRGPFLHTANFSVGIALLTDLVRRAHVALPDWQTEIVEIHHAEKRDAPSGTALRLAAELPPTVTFHPGLRAPDVTGIHAVRGGDVVGEHTVYFFGNGERIEVRHVATDRRMFALGALRCARWLVGKPPGVYRIEEVLH